MLDKSVPYVDILMHRKAEMPFEEIKLPKGFTISYFKKGDEKDWAIIETSVLEFDHSIDGLLYFQKRFLPYIDDLERRCVFIENENGDKIGTATAWWNYLGEKCVPQLHWVAIKPEYQGRGLGKAIVSYITKLMIEIDGDVDFYLSTQTWSHKAIKLYKLFGYEVSPIKDFLINKNNYDKAIEILKSLD